MTFSYGKDGDVTVLGGNGNSRRGLRYRSPLSRCGFGCRFCRRPGLQQFAGDGIAHVAAAVDGLDPEVVPFDARRADRVAESAREHLAAAASEDRDLVGVQFVFRVERGRTGAILLRMAAVAAGRGEAVLVPG